MPKISDDQCSSKAPSEKSRKRKHKNSDKSCPLENSIADTSSNGTKKSKPKKLKKEQEAASGNTVADDAGTKNSTPKAGKSRPKSKSAQKKKKMKLDSSSNKHPVPKSSSEGESEVEDRGPLSDLPNYVDKFGVAAAKAAASRCPITQCNLAYLAVDEICLEGLDGITLQALWTRISVVTDQPLPFPDGIVRYFWNIITSRNDIQFFALQEPRGELVIFDRYENRDPLIGACVDPIQPPTDIYPICPLKDPGLFGSASSFNTRTDISDEVRNLSLQEAESRYGMHLVMVATQKLRTRALINNTVDPNVEVTGLEYLLLERVARSRKVGELTQGTASLQVISRDSKVLFYNRKALLQHNMVNKQHFYLITSTAQQCACTLLHLERFYNVNKSKSQIMTEQIVELVRKRPNCRMNTVDVGRVFGHTKTLRKLFRLQEFQKVFKVETCYQLRDVYPDISPQQWVSKGINSEKIARTIELINPSGRIARMWNEDEPKDESSDDENATELVVNRPLLYQIYMFINNSGFDGLTLCEIRNITGFDYYSVRSAIKSLLSSNYICGVKIDVGRQRSIRYRCNYRVPTTNVFHEEEEDQESLDFVANVLGITDSGVLKQKTNSVTQQVSRTSHMGQYALIKQLRKQNKPENLKTLENIFKNQHDYQTFKNSINFNKTLEPLVIFTKKNYNNEVDNLNKTNFKQVCDRIKSRTRITWHPFLECYTPFPLSYTERVRNYQRFCNSVIKLVQPLLVQSKYEMKSLQPRYRYQCKQQLSKERLKEFSEEVPKLCKNDENQIKSGTSFPFCRKRIKFPISMGPKPEVIYKSVDNDGIEVTVTVSTKPEEFTETDVNYVKDNNATLRTIKRTKLVLDTVRREKIITDVFRITKLLLNLDIEDGHNARIDRKTIERIFFRLVKGGMIKILRISLQSAGVNRITTVLCDSTYELQYSTIESLIEQLKMKSFSSCVAQQQVNSLENEQFLSSDIKSSIAELYLLVSNDPPFQFQRSMARDYGSAPKFMKMRILHEFMFYLIYDFPSEYTVLNENTDTPIYSTELNWKMFVSPLPTHKSWPQGWTLISDLLLRLPLSLFVKICNVNFVIPELSELLEDPVKQHLLIKYLPPDIRNALLYKRKYIFTIHETICRLCFIGLVQFGPQKLRDKDQVFVYLNRTASLWDTTTSAAGYHHVEDKPYKQTKYHLKNADSVDNYWYEMWNICMHTKLGLRQTVTGTYITIVNIHHKPAMLEAMQPKAPHAAPLQDDGTVPGDKLGAAGFDSALWAHVKRNWIWGEKNEQKKKQNQIRSAVKKKTTMSRPKVIVRKVLPRKNMRTKTPKSEYDAVDKKLMIRLQQSRPEWFESEDKILQICKIVLLFLYRNSPRPFIPYTVIRDVLYKLSPISTNKTSSSVRRRLFTIFGGAEKQEPLQQIANTLDFLPYVKKYFHVIRNDEKQIYGAFLFLTIYFFKHQNEIQHVFDLLSGKTPLPEIPISNEVLEIKMTDSYVNRRKLTLYSKLDSNYPRMENEIILDTIQSIIHSSLAHHPQEHGWLIPLFCVYRKYPQELLKTALDHLRNNHLTCGRRSSAARKAKGVEGIPLITKYFQFSHYYCYTQITKFPPEIYIETHEIFLSVWRNKHSHLIPMEGFKQGHTVGLAELAVYIDAFFNVDIPNEVLVLNPNITDHTDLIRELAVRYKKMLTLVKSGSYFNEDTVGFDKSKYGCRWPMIHRFLRSWFLSDDGNSDDDTESIDAIDSQSESGVLAKKPSALLNEQGNQINKEVEPVINDSSTFEDYEKKLECFLITNNEPDVEEVIISDKLPRPDDINILQNYLSAFKTKRVTSERADKNITVVEDIMETETSEKEDERIRYLMNDELTVEQIMEEMLSDCPEEQRKVPKPTSLARLLVLGLFPELDDDEERLERLYKHFLVICPETTFLMPQEVDNNETMKHLHSEHVEVCKKLLKKAQQDSIVVIEVASVDEAMKKLKQIGGSQYDINFAERLINFIHKKKFIGATIRQITERLNETTDKLTLQEVFKVLMKLGIILQTGITHFVYVHHEYRKPWVVDSCLLSESDRSKLMDTKPDTLKSELPPLSSLESYKEIKVIMKPWILIDGSVNVPVFKKWLYIVLGHCLSDAVLPLTRLIELCGFLKPVDIYYLLKYLQYLKCVKLVTYGNEKCTLFSELYYWEMVDADITDTFEDIYVQCTNIALIKLGTLLNEKEQCYNFSVDEPLRYESF